MASVRCSEAVSSSKPRAGNAAKSTSSVRRNRKLWASGVPASHRNGRAKTRSIGFTNPGALGAVAPNIPRSCGDYVTNGRSAEELRAGHDPGVEHRSTSSGVAATTSWRGIGIGLSGDTESRFCFCGAHEGARRTVRWSGGARLFHNAKPELGPDAQLPELDAFQLNRFGLPALEQPEPVAEEDGHDVDMELIDQARAE